VRFDWLNGVMAEEFEDRDLSESVFWGVDLRKATFRDADFSGSTFFHTEWRDVTIDGVIGKLIVNGVDVTDFVNQHDRWYPLRERLSPVSVEGMKETWTQICGEWSRLLDAVAERPEDVANVSVGGEWSLRDTLRHLLFAMDKWFSVPVLGWSAFTSMGLPNTGSQGLVWPGIDRAADPSFDEVLRVRRESIDRFTRHLDTLDIGSVPENVDVPENGEVPGLMSYHVVFEEEFEHLRYMIRDLGMS